jgi:hypothetical protein
MSPLLLFLRIETIAAFLLVAIVAICSVDEKKQIEIEQPVFDKIDSLKVDFCTKIDTLYLSKPID